MEKVINPLTGELIPETITALALAQKELSEMAKKVEEAKQFIQGNLLTLLESEPNGYYESDNLIIRRQQSSRKEFDLDKVIDLLRGETKYMNEKNKEVDLYKPVTSAVQDFLALKAKRGELTQDESDKFRAAFIEKLSKPFVRIESK